MICVALEELLEQVRHQDLIVLRCFQIGSAEIIREKFTIVFLAMDVGKDRSLVEFSWQWMLERLS